jgi:hypothetical protein
VLAAFAHFRLLVDIFSMKILVWVLGRNGELLDSHLFFYHRYIELADYHWLHRHATKALKLEAIAEAHFQAAPDNDDGPPEAAAMALPARPTIVSTNVVSRTRLDKPPSVPANLVPRPAG